MTAEYVSRLDDLFAPWNRTDAPGLIVGIAFKGETLYRRGFGMASIEAGTALTPATKSRIGSTSKHFTALLALLLAEEGKLDLDAPVRTYISELSGPGGDPSIRQLLQHRGGSRCYLDLSFIAHGMATPPPGRAHALQVRQTGRNFPVGDETIYNNGGYQLVSTAIERAGGAPLSQQYEERLFKPLGMTNSRLLLSDHEIVPGMATLHVPDLEGGWRRGLFPVEEVRGEGGLISTVDDLLRWTAHLRRRDRFGNARTWKELIELPVFPDGSVGIYALGLMIETYRGLPVVHHAGGVIGGSSQMLTFPEEELDVIILSNGANGASPVDLAERIADILLDDRLGPPRSTIPADAHSGLVGHWWSPESEMVYTIENDDDVLKLGLCGSPAYVMRPQGDGDALVRTGAMGDIMIKLSRATETGLDIRFGQRTITHQRLRQESALEGATLHPTFSGYFRSADADCTLRFENDDGQNVAVFADIFGESRLIVEPLTDRIALARRRVGQLPFTLALSRQADGGLIVSTGRTRYLRFDPLE